jgi:hypothetical protein
MSAGQIADAIADMIYKSSTAQLVAVESILQQLVNSGLSVTTMTYQHIPDLNKELLVCRDVCVLLITRTYEGAAIKITYELYPDGRPHGWPELALAAR